MLFSSRLVSFRSLKCYDSVMAATRWLSSVVELKTLTRQEMKLAKQWADLRLPRSAMISQWLKVNIDQAGGIGTSGNEVCFVDTWIRPNIVVAIDFVQAHGLEKFPKMSMYTDYGIHTHHSAKVEQFLLQVIEKTSLTQYGGIEIRCLHPEWLPIFDRVFIARLSLNASVRNWRCKCFWLPPEGQNWLRQRRLTPPNGFAFSSLGPEDADLAMKFAEILFKNTSLALVERQLRHFPNVCLRETEGEKRVAGFALFEAELGTMSQLYVFPEFRRRGIGSLVEFKEAQSLYKKGHIPVKIITPDNHLGAIMSGSSSLWKHFGDCIFTWYGNQKMIRPFFDADKKKAVV